MMRCPRCEQEHDGAGWMIYDRVGETLEIYCPDCALELVQERYEKHQQHLKKISEN